MVTPCSRHVKKQPGYETVPSAMCTLLDLTESQGDLRSLNEKLKLKEKREEELQRLLEESSQVSTSDYEGLLLEKEQLLKSLERVSSELKLVNEELNSNMSSLERLETKKWEASERLHQLQEELTSLKGEREQLLQVLQGTRTERDELKNDLQENIELLSCVTEELQEKMAECRRLVLEKTAEPEL
ncbi:centromere-associated protein E-like [Latimeria chalumnae]|uniref:centromere-associated protein E-like n=1 Tax=Latimeria chalumnae TaxID=7897 RepID=UPI00313C2AEB